MLVIITGVESINKRLIARQVLAKMNDFIVDGWKMDLTKDDPFGIFNENGISITPNEFLHSGPEEELSIRNDILNKMIIVEKHDFQDHTEDNHFYHKFCSIEYDIGISPTILFTDPNDNIGWDNIPTTIDDIVERYNQSTLQYFTITGIFSKVAITQLRQRLGPLNVIVFNIIRNPSVVFTLNYKNNNFWDEQVSFNQENDTEKLYKSLYNAAILKELPYVTTVRFEDMIVNNEFIVDGKNVGLYLDYQSANGLLTKYEFNNRIPFLNVTNEMVNEFNQSIQPCSLTRIGNPPKADHVFSPWNLFEKLGYEPLTLETIVSG